MFIALSQRIIKNQDYGELRQALALDWGTFFKQELSPFLPLPLCEKIPFKNYKDKIVAVILSGGNDLSIFNASKENLIRDAYEKDIIKQSMLWNLPLLGICRGAQLLAHFFQSKLEACKGHRQNHKVYDTKGLCFEVNSYHNYAIKKLGKDLQPLVLAQDKSIEAFKHKDFPFFALMWHIERTKGLENKEILRLFLQSITKESV